MIIRIRPCVSILVFALLAYAAISSQLLAQKKIVTMSDYGDWRTVRSTVLSDDGNWITFDYGKPDADEDAEDERSLQIKNLVTEKIYEIPQGVNPQFSDDSRWIAYLIDVDRKKAKILRKQQKPIKQNVQLLNLESGEKSTWKNAAAFTFSKNSNVLAVAKPKSEGIEHAGSDLIVHDLKKNIDHHIGSVSSHSFNKQGDRLAYTRDAADKTANGLYYMNLETGHRMPLDQDSATYSQLIWNEAGTAIAALKGKEIKGFRRLANQLIAFTELNSDSTQEHGFNPVENLDFPKDMVISERARLAWNTDATKIFFGIRKQRPLSQTQGDIDKDESKNDSKSPKTSDLDIWHWKDVRIQSVQRARAKEERNLTFRSVFNIKVGKFVRLTDKSMRDIAVTRDGRWGIGRDNREYIHDWKTTKADYFRVDTNTGQRTLMLTAYHQSLNLPRRGSHGLATALSPDNKHFVYWKDSHFWLYSLDADNHINLTQDAPVSFTDMGYDYPDEKPSYGISGWTKDGKSVILNHRFDLWIQPLDGKPATNLTGEVGTDNEIRFRLIQLDDQAKFIDLSKPVLLSAYGQWTKKAGFYKLDVGEKALPTIEKPQPLIFKDKSFGRLTKSKNADRYMFTIQSFVDCPDVYVADGTFANPRRVTDANPQQVEYSWGHRVLFDYTNKDGVRLQGALAIPDGRRPGQRLPMIVSFYEKTSQYMHIYERPRYASGSASHLMEMVSKGYLFLLPDVHFNTGATGDDMLECIEAAVDKAVELGYADPDRVGLCGHSFSGYGAAYIATRSKKFAAVSAGAGVMELGSDFDHLWGYSVNDKGGSGENAHQYQIFGQGRMGTSPHENYQLYRSQSPITHVKEMTTPLLLMQGESDSTVAWIEAVGMYNAMRFNGKNIILLSYPGESHGLSKRVNKVDFTARMMEFFDHYLMGEPAADWIKHGVPFLEKKIGN